MQGFEENGRWAKNWMDYDKGQMSGIWIVHVILKEYEVLRSLLENGWVTAAG
jgi:hypothetical protein